MENYKDLIIFLTSKLLEETKNSAKINAVKAYVSSTTYANVDVILALLGIKKKGENDE